MGDCPIERGYGVILTNHRSAFVHCIYPLKKVSPCNYWGRESIWYLNFSSGYNNKIIGTIELNFVTNLCSGSLLWKYTLIIDKLKICPFGRCQVLLTARNLIIPWNGYRLKFNNILWNIKWVNVFSTAGVRSGIWWAWLAAL